MNPFTSTLPFLRTALACIVLGASATASAHPHGHDDDDDDGEQVERGSSAYHRAMSAHRDGDYDEAIEGFQRAHAAGYEPGATAYNIACGYARKGDADRAFQWLQRSLDEGFEVGEYLSHDDDLDSLRADPRMRAFARSEYDARAKRSQREAERAVAKYERVLERNPKTPHRFDEVGKELLSTGQYKLAGDAFIAAAARGEAESVSYYNAACARSIEGRTAEALELLRKAIETGYTDAEHMDDDLDLDNIRSAPGFAPLRQMAADLTVQPDYSELKRQFKNGRRGRFGHFNFDSEAPELWRPLLPKAEAATTKYPNLGLSWFNRGLVELRAGNPQAAIASYEKALQLGFRKKTSLYNLACAHAEAGNKDAAFRALNAAIDAGFTSRGQVRSDEDLDSLRDDPRYGEVLGRLRELDRRHSRHDD